MNRKKAGKQEGREGRRKEGRKGEWKEKKLANFSIGSIYQSHVSETQRLMQLFSQSGGPVVPTVVNS